MIEVLKKYNYWADEEIHSGYYRSAYLDKISGFFHNRLIKVIMGQRRTGKSYLLRMIIAHLIHNIRDVYLLEKLMDFMIDSTGSFFSINKVVNYLKSSGYRSNVETIGNYVNYMKETFFIHEVERFDIKGKRILSSEKKYYLNDLGFKYFLSSSFDFGVDKYLENAVFLDLKRKGYRVFTGTQHGKEIDFIAEKD
ncbi:MAG TPA: hypothetical protein VK186_22705 [Candidatus Deferrimicrobium sp.]|nr:hypothetical protein [Candidatus Kapabacteria bacterium]HLP61669.1 hypothetical protein [Candidatus Deferrimicrobium sp.]